MMKNYFDNDMMPAYAAVVALWGTIFLELWKRQNSKLVYMWNVKSFEEKEPDRPQYSKQSSQSMLIRSFWIKLSISTIIIISMMLLVVGITTVFILYRVRMSVDFCSDVDSLSCFMVSEIVAIILNSILIIILEQIHKIVAYKLTEWENYRTLTEFNDAIIIKLFAFSFTNSYVTCFYTAFFRVSHENGIFGFGAQYNDVCTTSLKQSCMPLLSLQIIVLMVLKPLPKFTTDFLIPYLKQHFIVQTRIAEVCNIDILLHVEKEYLKEPLDEFTLSEYTEKVILYGYLMLFAASFPLAPLFAMLTLMIDIRIDEHRLLHIYRRPIPFIAEDIGMWYDILNFINTVGVVVNACLIAFTSTWGERFSTTEKLIFVLIFENVVFGLKFLIAILIPDVPSIVKKAKRMDILKSDQIMSLNNPNMDKFSKYYKSFIQTPEGSIHSKNLK